MTPAALENLDETFGIADWLNSLSRKGYAGAAWVPTIDTRRNRPGKTLS